MHKSTLKHDMKWQHKQKHNEWHRSSVVLLYVFNGEPLQKSGPNILDM